jgi:D-erythro-7,8-dihydroneopterin triphosphate epimerase
MTDAAPRPSLDQIVIHDLRLRCVVGLEPQERLNKQEVIVQISLHVDLRKAGRTDRIADTVDYKALKKEILRMAESSRFHLVEALAQGIADICLARDRVARVEVTVEKPGALRFARTVGVRIVRGRE